MQEIRRDLRNQLVVLNGVSGAGKSTLLKYAQGLPGFNERYGFCVSHTTRAPRVGEIDGVHYHFVTVQQFQEMIQAGAFVEHAQVHENYYGTSYAALLGVLNERNVILDVDTNGLTKLRGRPELAERMKALLIMPPAFGDIEKRLRARGTETEDSIKRRLTTAHAEMNFYTEKRDLYDTIIVNDVQEKAEREFVKAIGFAA